MNNLILFVNAFLSYLLVFVLIIALVIVACIIGVKCWKSKDTKEVTAEKQTEAVGGNTTT
ncbi:MAG: hypothetical protein HDR28_10765 [Lachnospiraceae bacterium]|nr:hypothetical protein [Lachnospiraceae bacterium]